MRFESGVVLFISLARLHLLLHFSLSHSHFASTNANEATRGSCSKGTSCAINNKPRGNIQRPKTGKKLKMPPRMRRIAMTRRIANEEGIRNQRMN
jgi:hypothetical protein